MDVKKAIAELTSQLSEVNYDSEEDNILLKDYHPSSLDDGYKSDGNNESKLRKASETLTLPENIYGGKKTSRKKFNSASEGSESEKEIASEDDIADEEVQEEEEEEEDDEEADESSDYEEANGSGEESGSDSNEDSSKDLSKNVQSKKGSERDCNIYSAASKNVPNDVKKGVAIRNQLSICENLLKCRIKLQKALSASNSLPGEDELSKTNKEELNRCKNKVLLLLGKLGEVQEELLKQSAEYIPKSKDVDSNTDDEIPSDESDPENVEDVNNEDVNDEQPRKKLKLNDYASALNSTYSNLIPYRNSSIQKWNDKTKVSTGKMANSNFSAFDQSTLKQIEQIMADKSRLIRRTQIRRSNTAKNNLDETNTQDVPLDPEIFDDTDFYHKLLRDYIEKKSVDASNSSNTERQLIELQKLRSKMKRNVDTKSTKGRKLRYVVLPKLVNFMAPRPYNTWNESAETELYSSLFGKIKQS